MKRYRNFACLTRDYIRVYKEIDKQKLLRLDMTEQETLKDAYKKGKIPIECKVSIENIGRDGNVSI